MARNITISSANNIGVNNNTYRYDFKQGGVEFDDDTYLSCNQIIVPNSVSNISSALSNNQFGYITYGQSFSGGSQLTGTGITFSISAGSGTTRTVNITSGFLWIGYVVVISGITTSTPIIITNMSINDVNSATASITFNQSIVNASPTTGVGYIAGNQMIIQTSSGVPLPNMFMYPPYLLTTGSNQAIYQYSSYITSVLPQTNNLNNSIYLTTWSQSIPTNANAVILTNTTHNLYLNQVSLTDGYYTITDLNTAMQKQMYRNGHYWFYQPVISGVSTTGENNATVVYPLTLDYKFPQYCFKLTSVSSPASTALTTTFGSNAGMNNNFITNGSFDDFIISNTLITIANGSSQTITSQIINGWTATTNAGTGTHGIGFGQGINGYVANTPPTGLSQYIILNPSLTSDTCTITQTTGVYFPAGTYVCSFWLCKTFLNGGGPLDIINVSLDTTYGVSLQDTQSWVEYSQTFTSTGQTIAVAFANSSTFATSFQAFSITGITFKRTTYPLANNWKYGYSTAGNVSLFLNAYQTPSFTSDGIRLTANYTNPYSLTRYLMNNQNGTNVVSLSSVNGYLPYGLGMNINYGISIRCNLLENPMNKNSDILDSFSLMYPFGSNNLYAGDPHNDIKIKKGRYSSMVITLCDVNGQPITLLDNNVLLTFVISKKNPHISRFRLY